MNGEKMIFVIRAKAECVICNTTAKIDLISKDNSAAKNPARSTKGRPRSETGMLKMKQVPAIAANHITTVRYRKYSRKYEFDDGFWMTGTGSRGVSDSSKSIFQRSRNQLFGVRDPPRK